MERKIAKLIVLTSIFIGVAVAFTPLTSYAEIINPSGVTNDNCDPSATPSTLVNSDGWGIADASTGGCAAQNTGARKVAVNVNSQISLDAVSGASINVTPHVLGTGSISATVTSTHPYTISLSAAQTSLQATDNNSLTIPAGSNFTKDDDAWGIKKQNASSYSAITTSPVVYYTNNSPATGATTNFEVGVAVTEATAPKNYQTAVTVTATTQY